KGLEEAPAERLEEAALAPENRVVGPANIAHAKPQPRVDRLDSEGLAGGREEVAVPGGVDDGLREARLAAGLALRDHSADGSVGDDRLGDPPVKASPHSGFHDQLAR